jgi:hypothetical protein
MLTEQEIRAAVEFESHEHSVLSVYLNVDPNLRSVEQFKQALRTLLAKVDKAEAEDVKRVQSFVEIGFNRKGRGLVMFSCANADFWWAQTLNVPVEDAIFTSFRPYIRQLAYLLDTYQKYGVIYVDQEGARLHLFHMGNLQSIDGYLGEEIKQHRAGGWAAQRYQRHETQQARQNLQEIAEQAEAFYRETDTQHLILAGTEKNVAVFKELLSNRLRAMVIGRIAAAPNASPAEIQERALALVQQAAQQSAKEYADNLVAQVRANRYAVNGLVNTLTAIQNGRAEHVVVMANYAQPGYRFVDSGLILLELNEDVELGSGRIQELPDAVESAIRRALLQSVPVTLIDNHPELEQIGKIGALTRY